jgi:hypothetical protein
MGKGVLYKSNASTWSKSQSKKFTASAISTGKVRHANASTWFDNYPMEEIFTQTFGVSWTQAYNGSGVKLDSATWGDHPRCGDSVNFQGLFGFDNDAMRTFVASGVIQSIKFTCMFDDPSHAGTPVVSFAPHVYTSKPTSYNGNNANKNYATSSTFNQTGADYTRQITLPIGAWLNGSFGGVLVYAGATAGNSTRFAGKTTSHSLNGYNSVIEISVLK